MTTTKTATHTPGPWKALHGIGVSEIVHYVSGVPETVITTPRYGEPDERQANARLITAAPEMAEALMDLLINNPKHFSPKARVALAKAGLL